MTSTELLQALFRWIHVVAAIVWLGHLYFFNFVNLPFEATLDAPTKRAVVPQLRPRALFWFRWGAAWTWVSGFLLLLLVFYHGKLALASPAEGWTAGAWIMLAVTLLGFGVYDAIAASALGADDRRMAAIGFALIALFLFLCIRVGGYGYRGYVIHTGALFGTIMAANVWMRIWPAQRRVIAAVRDGEAPDPALVARAGARSRHNAYLSIPLVWTMLDAHTLGLGGPLVLLGVIVVGWFAVAQLYAKAQTVPGA
jgi:uncharacterized membrane protein